MVKGNKFVIAVRTVNAVVKAFDVCIRRQDVYVNYSDASTPEAHGSYHASGQRHIKVGGDYVKWSGGLMGRMEPMKLFRTPPGSVSERSSCWTIGWGVSELHRVLPLLTGTADMTVDSCGLDPTSILGFKVDVIGNRAKRQLNIVGFPIVASQQFGGSVRIEVTAFVVGKEDT